MRQKFWHGQCNLQFRESRICKIKIFDKLPKAMGPPQKKKKKRKRKIQTIQVPLPTIQNFPWCPIAAQKGWPIKKFLVHNSWQNGCLPKLPHVQNLDWCQTTYVLSSIHVPVFYPSVKRPRLYVHPCSISVLHVHKPGSRPGHNYLQDSKCLYLIGWIGFFGLPPKVKTVRRKNSISKFTNRKCEQFSSRQKGHPNDE